MAAIVVGGAHLLKLSLRRQLVPRASPLVVRSSCASRQRIQNCTRFSCAKSRIQDAKKDGVFPRKLVERVSAAAFSSGILQVKMGDAEVMDAVQKRLMFEDECILVNGNDEPVGHDNKYNCHLWEKIEKEDLLHRAFSVFLFNWENKLLLQRRSATKVTFPLVWTNTCCSHPLYRESEMIEEDQLGVKNAAVRKLKDELGIEAEDVPVGAFTCLGRIHYKAPSNGKWGEHEIDYLLFIKRDVRLEPNPDEVADVEFVDQERLREIVRKADAGEDGITLSPWFRLVVDKFLFEWWAKMENGTLVDAIDMGTIHRL